MLLSVVIPCYNEEEVILHTHRRLSAVLAQCKDFETEVVYIDDGSKDNTLPLLREIHIDDPTARILSLSRNFGHQIALTAGLHHAAGDVIIIIDADLQDPPELIPDLLAKWREGYSVVYGVRTTRVGETKFKLWTARLFYDFINSLSEVAIPKNTGDFRLMDRKALDGLLALKERFRFIRGMVSWVGFPQTPLYYERPARFAGETKYPLNKMIRFATDAIISFSSVPLRFVTWMGLTMSMAAMLGVAYALALRLFTNIWVEGWTLLFIAVLIIGGVQLLSLGIIGEYIGRIYGEVKQRPLYLVNERLGFGDAGFSMAGSQAVITGDGKAGYDGRPAR